MAARIYNHISINKWLLSEEQGHDVGMEAAARDWYERFHLPLPPSWTPTCRTKT